MNKVTNLLAHVCLVFSSVMIAEWILTLFNPTIGLLSVNEPFSRIWMLLCFLTFLVSGIFQTVGAVKQTKNFVLRADTVLSCVLTLQWFFSVFLDYSLLSVSSVPIFAELLLANITVFAGSLVSILRKTDGI